MDKSRVFERLQPEDNAFVCLAYYLLVGGGEGVRAYVSWCRGCDSIYCKERVIYCFISWRFVFTPGTRAFFLPVGGEELLCLSGRVKRFEMDYSSVIWLREVKTYGILTDTA